VWSTAQREKRPPAIPGPSMKTRSAGSASSSARTTAGRSYALTLRPATSFLTSGAWLMAATSSSPSSATSARASAQKSAFSSMETTPGRGEPGAFSAM
jgi:hypothetical protein